LSSAYTPGFSFPIFRAGSGCASFIPSVALGPNRRILSDFWQKLCDHTFDHPRR
jgi:hypothetical protein